MIIECLTCLYYMYTFIGNLNVCICACLCVTVRSAGAGRTGTFIALSNILERVKAEGLLDVFQTVKSLRMQRPHMVQTVVRDKPIMTKKKKNSKKMYKILLTVTKNLWTKLTFCGYIYNQQHFFLVDFYSCYL